MADEGTAAPIEIPVPATGVPGSVPSGVVALRGGIVVPIPPCANTGLLQNEAETTAIINNGLIRIPLAEWVTWVRRQDVSARDGR
jgi:hypothetical protein